MYDVFLCCLIEFHFICKNDTIFSLSLRTPAKVDLQKDENYRTRNEDH